MIEPSSAFSSRSDEVVAGILGEAGTLRAGVSRGPPACTVLERVERRESLRRPPRREATMEKVRTGGIYGVKDSEEDEADCNWKNTLLTGMWLS